MSFLGLAIALGGMGWSLTSAAASPTPEELAPKRVVVVSEMPRGRGTITKAEFQHELTLSSAAAGRTSTPKPGDRAYEKLKVATLKNQLEAVWIFGQAAEWNIYATRRQVKRELVLIKKESFRSAAEFRHFIRKSHYTDRDLHERVRIQLLSERLQERIREKVGNVGQKAEQKAFEQFIEEFAERWRSRTVCAPEYVINHCSNGPAFP